MLILSAESRFIRLHYSHELLQFYFGAFHIILLDTVYIILNYIQMLSYRIQECAPTDVLYGILNRFLYK